MVAYERVWLQCLIEQWSKGYFMKVDTLQKGSVTRMAA